MIEILISDLKTHDDFREITAELSIETLEAIATDWFEFELKGEGKETHIYFIGVGTMFYIVFSRDSKFSFEAFSTWEDDLWSELLKMFNSNAREA
jgi:hypothetical protein